MAGKAPAGCTHASGFAAEFEISAWAENICLLAFSLSCLTGVKVTHGRPKRARRKTEDRFTAPPCARTNKQNGGTLPVWRLRPRPGEVDSEPPFCRIKPNGSLRNSQAAPKQTPSGVSWAHFGVNPATLTLELSWRPLTRPHPLRPRTPPVVSTAGPTHPTRPLLLVSLLLFLGSLLSLYLLLSSTF